MMSQKKSIAKNNYQPKIILDNILWLVENYLPQKKKRSSYSDFRLDKFESFFINKIKNFASGRTKSLGEDLSKTKLTFTVGNWALPYLNLLKKKKFLK